MSRGIAAGRSLRSIAQRLGKAPSTVSRELKRNGGRGGYRAGQFAAIAALFLISRIITVGLTLTYAPEDAEPYFYVKQILISAICLGVIAWLWSRRIRQPQEKKDEG